MHSAGCATDRESTNKLPEISPSPTEPAAEETPSRLWVPAAKAFAGPAWGGVEKTVAAQRMENSGPNDPGPGWSTGLGRATAEIDGSPSAAGRAQDTPRDDLPIPGEPAHLGAGAGVAPTPTWL